MDFKLKLRKFYYWLFPRMYECKNYASITHTTIESPIIQDNGSLLTEICLPNNFSFNDSKIIAGGISSCYYWNPYVRISPNFKTYNTKIEVVKPSPYGDNLDKDLFSEILI